MVLDDACRKLTNYIEYLQWKANLNKKIMIEKLSDLRIGAEYYVSSSPELSFTKLYRLSKIDFKQCTIEIEHLKRGGAGSISVYDIDEIGIGMTKEEAINNYGQIKVT